MSWNLNRLFLKLNWFMYLAVGSPCSWRPSLKLPFSLGTLASPFLANLNVDSVKVRDHVINGWILWRFSLHLVSDQHIPNLDSVLAQKFWPKWVEILMYPNPTGYMFTSFSFRLLIWGIISKCLSIVFWNLERWTGYFSNSTSHLYLVRGFPSSLPPTLKVPKVEAAKSVTPSWTDTYTRLLTTNIYLP